MTTAKIAAKGTKSTGLTEDIAKTLHDQLGKTVIAIVEITSDARTEKKSGDEEVKLSLQMIEVAPNRLTEEHLRELARSFHYERRLAEDGPTLHGENDGPEPKVADVLAAGARHRPHPFLPVDASQDNGICDVCGALEAAPLHSAQDTLPDPADNPEEEPAGDDGDTCAFPGCVLDDEHDDDHTDEDGAPLDPDDRHLTAVTNPFSPGGGLA